HLVWRRVIQRRRRDRLAVGHLVRVDQSANRYDRARRRVGRRTERTEDVVVLTGGLRGLRVLTGEDDLRRVLAGVQEQVLVVRKERVDAKVHDGLGGVGGVLVSAGVQRRARLEGEGGSFR